MQFVPIYEGKLSVEIPNKYVVNQKSDVSFIRIGAFCFMKHSWNLSHICVLHTKSATSGPETAHISSRVQPLLVGFVLFNL